MEVGLNPLGRDIEGIAGLDPKVLRRRGMVERGLAHQLEPATSCTAALSAFIQDELMVALPLTVAEPLPRTAWYTACHVTPCET